MHYFDGRRVNVGDKVELWLGRYGIVVCSIDDEGFTADYSEANWAYLKVGVLIEMDNGELMHYPESDSDLVFISGLM
jgi:hypothetical protein